MYAQLPDFVKAIATRERFRSIDLTALGGERIACPRQDQDDVFASNPDEAVLSRLGKEYRDRIPKMKRDAKTLAAGPRRCRSRPSSSRFL
ncbi:MAG: hypothetical protein MZW92_02550 [Comamonadaceae bacterium]|nr:hypothetical protein [Comamonadaceae bacterium]